MADVVSDLVLSFFCCCFYAPGDNHRGVGTHHYSGGHAHHPTGRNAAYHHRGGAGSRRRSVSLQTVELKVRMCCEGCERAVRHALQNLRGLDRVDVNVPMEKVTVTGYVDRARVLQEVRRSGKKAEFWPSGGAPLWFTSPRSYFRDDGGSYGRDSYNYRHHGYSDGDRHGRMRGAGLSATCSTTTTRRRLPDHVTTDANAAVALLLLVWFQFFVSHHLMGSAQWIVSR